MEVRTEAFGSYTDPTDPTTPIPVTKFIIQNPRTGVAAHVIDYGAALTNLFVRDGRGELKDVVLGYDTLEEYLGLPYPNPYFGATIGRVSNRIRRGRFTLAGQVVQLVLNEGEHHLHGGVRGFDKWGWKGSITSPSSVVFSRISPGGEQGYPNLVHAQVKYTLNEMDELGIEFVGSCDGDSPMAFTNHTYFNLQGHQATPLRLKDHTIQISADKYTEIDGDLIPTGESPTVISSRFDLREGKLITEILEEDPAGIDHNFCLIPGAPFAARVTTPELVMTVTTDLPGLQFYTGNFLPEGDEQPGKGGLFYYKNGAFCLEAQAYPDSVNNPGFPSVFYKAGDIYRAKSVYAFRAPI